MNTCWIELNEKHQKNNCLITKLVYIHEGIEKEAPKSKRHKLVNPYYFCGTSYGEENSEFWDELRTAIRSKTKQDFEEIVDRLKDCLEGEAGLKRIAAARDYILSNWMAAKLRLRHKNGVKGSSTEGHVSHVLSSRMSSRPMGWSIQGATKMAKLRAYEMNGGDMLALVRYQKRELPKAAGAEYDVISSSDMLQAEKNRHGELGKYVDCITHTLSLQSKKKAYFNSHIWGL